MYQKIIFNELNEAKKLLNRFMFDSVQIELIEKSAKLLINAIKNDKKIMVCGNGGSHCDAMHFSGELIGRYREKSRKGIPILTISDPSYFSCISNDFGYENVFSRFIETMGRSEDVLLTISTSGNSNNIVLAAKSARNKNIQVISLTGKNGGEVSKFSNIEIRVPYFDYPDRIQEIHIKILHILALILEKKIFNSFD